MAFVVFPAGPADAADIAAVHVAAWRETYRGLLPAAFLASMSEAKHAERWRRALSRPAENEFVLAAADRRGLVGYCAAGPSRFRVDGEGEISTLYLLRRAQGAGLGRTLLTDAARGLQTLGAASLVISVLRENARARGFCAHLGGRPDPPRAERGPGGVLYEVAYRWADIRSLLGGA